MNQLQHHGILGQKWGVRRFQNPDGSYTKAGIERYYGRKNIKKGTSLYRISGEESLTPGRGVYVVRTNNDRKDVKGLASKLASYRNVSKDKMFEYELKTNKNIKLASVSDVREAQQEVIKDHPEYANSSAITLANQNKPIYIMPNIEEGDDIDSYMNRLKTKIYTTDMDYYRRHAETLFSGKDYAEKAILEMSKQGAWSEDPEIQEYINFGLMALDSNIGKDENYQKAIIEKLKNKGFDAMYDVNLTSGKSKGELEESLLLFDPQDITEINRRNIDSK